ncbi:hypothetical protein NC651_024711 [Populus alba x Populus x berolinensis]|nr:hypothetical protein NC651_024711 [Populus alba x Populus x berolinensis]
MEMLTSPRKSWTARRIETLLLWMRRRPGAHTDTKKMHPKRINLAVKTGKKKMMLLTGLSIMDLVVAGISLVIGLGIFVFIASILCSAAFLHNAKHVFLSKSWGYNVDDLFLDEAAAL